jgi:hypothetical protein
MTSAGGRGERYDDASNPPIVLIHDRDGWPHRHRCSSRGGLSVTHEL